MRIENYNMTRKEAERLGLRPGRKFEHYFIITQTASRNTEGLA